MAAFGLRQFFAGVVFLTEQKIVPSCNFSIRREPAPQLRHIDFGGCADQVPRHRRNQVGYSRGEIGDVLSHSRNAVIEIGEPPAFAMRLFDQLDCFLDRSRRFRGRPTESHQTSPPFVLPFSERFLRGVPLIESLPVQAAKGVEPRLNLIPFLLCRRAAIDHLLGRRQCLGKGGAFIWRQEPCKSQEHRFLSLRLRHGRLPGAISLRSRVDDSLARGDKLAQVADFRCLRKTEGGSRRRPPAERLIVGFAGFGVPPLGAGDLIIQLGDCSFLLGNGSQPAAFLVAAVGEIVGIIDGALEGGRQAHGAGKGCDLGVETFTLELAAPDQRPAAVSMAARRGDGGCVRNGFSRSRSREPPRRRFTLALPAG